MKSSRRQVFEMIPRRLPARGRYLSTLAGSVASVLVVAACGGQEGPSPIEPEEPHTGSIYVTTAGWAGAEGTTENPLDLATALSARSPAVPGDTVWIAGGRYRGSFESMLSGTEQAPITVRPMPGEHVVIDSQPNGTSALSVEGDWTIFRDLEITNSDPIRISHMVGSQPTDLKRGSGVNARGAGTKLINLVIHDLTGGIGMWGAIDGEAYGNIIFYNGWQSQEGGHGHGIYTQNETGTRRLTDNIIFSQFGVGLHVYGSDQASLDHINLEGNVIFNNGILLDDSYRENILLGGGQVAREPVLRSNYTYYIPGYRAGAGNNIGYDVGCEGLVMEDNYFAHFDAGFAFQLVNCAGIVERNVVVGNVRAVEGQTIVTRPEVEQRYPNNDYVLDRPTGVHTVVRPNRYEPGRAHVVIYNWDGASEVAVDLADAGLKGGEQFELTDIQNLDGPPVVTGTYSGEPVPVPVSGLTETSPVVGHTRPPHSAPEFSVFLLRSSPPEPAPGGFGSFMKGLFGLRH